MGTPADLSDSILEIIVSHFPYFRERPIHLAWAVMHYELIHSLNDSIDLVMISDDDMSPVQQVCSTLGLEEDVNLLWAALETVTSFDFGFADANPNVMLQWRRKTFDEWVELLTTTGDFDYHTVARDEVALELFTRSSSFRTKWTQDGYLVRVSRNGLECSSFFGYSRCESEVAAVVKDEIISVRTHPLIRDTIDGLLESHELYRQRVYGGESWKKVYCPELYELEKDIARGDEFLRESATLLHELGVEVFPLPVDPPAISFVRLRADSSFVTMPSNVHPSYVVAGELFAQQVLACPGVDLPSVSFAREFLEKIRNGYFNRY